MYCKTYNFADTMDMVNSMKKSEKTLRRKLVSKEEWGQTGNSRKKD